MIALPQTIPHAAEAAAKRWPDALALIEGNDQRTFAQLWAESRRVGCAASTGTLGDTQTSGVIRRK